MSSAVSGVNNRHIITPQLPLNKYVHVKISQVQLNYLFYFTIDIGGKRVHTELNRDARIFRNVKVFVSDPWHPEAACYIRNLKYKDLSYKKMQGKNYSFTFS